MDHPQPVTMVGKTSDILSTIKSIINATNLIHAPTHFENIVYNLNKENKEALLPVRRFIFNIIPLLKNIHESKHVQTGLVWTFYII